MGSWNIGDRLDWDKYKIGMTDLFSIVEDLGIRLNLDFLFPSCEEES